MPAILQNQSDEMNQQNAGTMDNALSNQPGIVENKATNIGQVDLGGSQSGSIQGGQATTPQSSNQPKQKKGTGFTNVQQYVQANQGAGQQIANAAQAKLSSQANAIKTQVQKANQTFNTQAQQNQERLGQARTFGTGALDRANTVMDTNYAQQQQDALQGRINAIGQVPEQDYAANIQAKQSQLDQQKQEYAQQQAAEQKAIADVNAQNQAFSMQEAAYKPIANKIASGELQVRNGQLFDPGAPGRSSGVLQDQSAQKQYQDYIASKNAYDQSLAARNQINPNNQGYQQSEQELEALQLNQKKAQRQQELGQELSGLQAKIQNNQPLSDLEVSRYRDIVEGREIYDNLAYNSGNTISDAQALQQKAGLANTEAGRRQLLRDTFANNANYTRGQTALDQLLMQGDQNVTNQFINQANQIGNATLGSTQQAKRQALQKLAELSVGGATLRSDLTKGVDQRESALGSEVDARLATGEGSQLANLKQAYQSGMLSQEQAKMLGLDDSGSTYGADIGSLIGDVTKGATRESTSNLNDLARAQALAKLGGRVEQTIFTNPDTVGQLSPQQKVQLAAIQEGIYDAQKKSEQAKAAAQSQVTSGLRAGRTDQIGDYVQNNTQAIIDKFLSSGQQPTAAGIQAALANPASLYGGGHAQWGVGEFGDVSNAYGNLTQQQQKDLTNRIAVEGSDASLTASQRQALANQQDIRRQALQALQAGSFRNEGMWNRSMNELNPVVAGPKNKETVQQAYERLTGRKLT